MTLIPLAMTTALLFSQRLPNDADLLRDLRSYRTWAKVNPRPALMDEITAARCYQPMELQKYWKSNPHKQRYITVFVTKSSEKPLRGGSVLPVGTQIVKEKHKGLNGPVELSTVMVKREKGYNLACGDWEFAVLSADARKLLSRGKLESCMNCHKQQGHYDFTYRTYLMVR